MDALPTSGVWQFHRRMPVESDYVVAPGCGREW